MPKIRRIYTTLLCSAAVLYFLYCMIIPPNGAQSFHDVVGNWLVVGISGCFGLAMIMPLIRLYANQRISERAGIIARCMFAGLGFILLGCWAYGEKDRFAALPVTQVEAQVTKLNAYSRSGFRPLWPRSRRYSVEYKYADQSGAHYISGDVVYDGSTWRRLKLGGPIPVNYLQADPKVSRMIAYNHERANRIKGFFVLLGVGIMFSTGWLLRLKKEETQKIDAWLTKRAVEKDGKQYK